MTKIRNLATLNGRLRKLWGESPSKGCLQFIGPAKKLVRHKDTMPIRCTRCGWGTDGRRTGNFNNLKISIGCRVCNIAHRTLDQLSKKSPSLLWEIAWPDGGAKGVSHARYFFTSKSKSTSIGKVHQNKPSLIHSQAVDFLKERIKSPRLIRELEEASNSEALKLKFLKLHPGGRCAFRFDGTKMLFSGKTGTRYYGLPSITFRRFTVSKLRSLCSVSERALHKEQALRLEAQLYKVDDLMFTRDKKNKLRIRFESLRDKNYCVPVTKARKNYFYNGQHHKGESLCAIAARFLLDLNPDNWQRNQRPEFLRFHSGVNLELDIFHPETRIAIEFQGFQHKAPLNSSDEAKEKFERLKERDDFKRRRCMEEGITLVEIWQDDVSETVPFQMAKALNRAFTALGIEVPNPTPNLQELDEAWLRFLANENERFQTLFKKGLGRNELLDDCFDRIYPGKRIKYRCINDQCRREHETNASLIARRKPMKECHVCGRIKTNQEKLDNRIQDYISDGIIDKKYAFQFKNENGKANFHCPNDDKHQIKIHIDLGKWIDMKRTEKGELQCHLCTIERLGAKVQRSNNVEKDVQNFIKYAETLGYVVDQSTVGYFADANRLTGTVACSEGHLTVVSTGELRKRYKAHDQTRSLNWTCPVCFPDSPDVLNSGRRITKKGLGPEARQELMREKYPKAMLLSPGPFASNKLDKYWCGNYDQDGVKHPVFEVCLKDLQKHIARNTKDSDLFCKICHPTRRTLHGCTTIFLQIYESLIDSGLPRSTNKPEVILLGDEPSQFSRDAKLMWLCGNPQHKPGTGTPDNYLRRIGFCKACQDAAKSSFQDDASMSLIDA